MIIRVHKQRIILDLASKIGHFERDSTKVDRTTILGPRPIVTCFHELVFPFNLTLLNRSLKKELISCSEAGDNPYASSLPIINAGWCSCQLIAPIHIPSCLQCSVKPINVVSQLLIFL